MMRRSFNFQSILRSNRKLMDLRKFSEKVNERKRQSNKSSSSESSSSFKNVTIINVAALAALSYLIYDINNPNGQFYKMFQDSFVHKQLKSFYDYLFNEVSYVFQPAEDKILPDWGDPAVYGELPPGTPAPPLLVLDLEKTLIGSVYDAANGWRHFKRPGVDKLIDSLVQYYEIVIFSENDSLPEEVWTAIDKDRRCHRISSVGGELRDHRILKRLDKMNRDLHRIILVDDNEITSQLYPNNTIIVPPYDINNVNDRILFDLIPFLQAFLHEGVEDLPQALDKFGTHNAEDLVVEYSMLVTQKRREDNIKRNRGLGGILRNKSTDSSELSELVGNQSKILSSTQIAGVDPVSLIPESKPKSNNPFIPKVGFQPTESKKTNKNQTILLDLIESTSREKEALDMKKREEMNKLYMKQLAEKKKLEEEKKMREFQS